MKKLITIIVLIVLKHQLYAQAPTIQWQKTYGGSLSDIGYSLCASSDGGYLIAASTCSYDGDVTFNHSMFSICSDDIWLIKIDSSGTIIWDKSLGGEFDEEPASILRTFDNGYIVYGTTDSEDGDVIGLHIDSVNPFPHSDGWLVKTDSIGQIQWQKCFGGLWDDYGRDLILTSDSNYLLAEEINNGNNFSGPSGNINFFYGDKDYWLAKIGLNGNIIWQSTFGNSSSDIPYACAELTGNEYVIAGGVVNSFTGNHGGGGDVGIAKVNSSGGNIWTKCYGGYSIENAFSIASSNNNSLIVANETGSDSGDISTFYGTTDIWIFKADSIGNILWEKSYGGSYYDVPQKVIATTDGGILIAGFTSSTNHWITNNHGFNDFWVFKLDSLGNWEWGITLGGSDDDRANSIIETNDHGFLVCGYTKSSDGDVTSNHGNEDVWVVKLSPPPLGIQTPENQLTDFTSFQNGDQLMLRFFSKHAGASVVTLVNTLGATILEKEISIREGMNYATINLPAMAEGMYFIHAAGNGVGRGKVFVSRR